MTPSSDWPRQYLLQIYAEAVKHGFIWIEPISPEDARSLTQRLYRLRRRADKAMAPYILPEYHLVTCGDWRPTTPGGTLGKLPVIFNQLPTGAPLPAIRPATADEMGEVMVEAEMMPPSALPAGITEDSLKLDPDEVSGYVDDLIGRARRKAKEPDQ